MENASKALIMAAGVLIGIMILSLAVYLFATFGSTSAELHKQKETDQLNQFNSQFTSYAGKEDITIYDVITVSNLATENNKYYELERLDSLPTTNEVANNYIGVLLDNERLDYGKSTANETINKKYNSKINDELKEINGTQKYLKKYTCKVDISSNTGRVYKVTFTKK